MTLLSELQFVKLKIPRLIPKELIESVKGSTFTPEQFYQYQEENRANPCNHLYALIDKDKQIHGYLWAESTHLDRSLFVNTLSVSKEFWGKGEALQMALDHIEKMREMIHFKKLFWFTFNEKFFLKHGFTRSKNVLMEYDINKKEGEK